MLLAIDIGNTNTVLGVFDGDRLVHSWRVKTDARNTADELMLTYKGLLQDVPVTAIWSPTGNPAAWARLVEREQRPPAQKRVRARRIQGEERRLVRMVAGVKAPAGAPFPARGERLHQIGNGAEALRIRAEVQGRRRAHGIGRHRLRQHQIARERIEHVLPRPHRLRIA